MTNMALNQTNKLVWIVETIYRAHKISFEELNRRWMDNVRYDIIIANGDRQVILDTLSESLC
jgi:hypothetical protein